MCNQVQSNFREIKEGRRIWLLNTIKNHSIEIPTGTFGKIVHAQNQVAADVWFRDDFHRISKSLGVETGFCAKNSFSGVVLNVKATDFAVVYNPEKDSNIMVYENKLNEIPFLSLENVPCAVGHIYKGNKPLYQYRMEDLIEKIESVFTEWVSDLDTIENDDADSECVDIFTAEAQEEFNEKQNEVIESFGAATGIYYEFLGGAI